MGIEQHNESALLGGALVSSSELKTRELRASARPRNLKKRRLFNIFISKSKCALAGILIRSNNYYRKIVSCTYTPLVLQFPQHILNYKNRFEVPVFLAA